MGCILKSALKHVRHFLSQIANIFAIFSAIFYKMITLDRGHKSGTVVANLEWDNWSQWLQFGKRHPEKISKLTRSWGLKTRSARFFSVKHTKTGKNIPNHNTLYQMPIKIAIGRKIFQITIEYTNVFHSKALRNVPKFGFLVRKYMRHLAIPDFEDAIDGSRKCEFVND
jgi:hypothetical protein